MKRVKKGAESLNDLTERATRHQLRTLVSFTITTLTSHPVAVACSTAGCGQCTVKVISVDTDATERMSDHTQPHPSRGAADQKHLCPGPCEVTLYMK